MILHEHEDVEQLSQPKQGVGQGKRDGVLIFLRKPLDKSTESHKIVVSKQQSMEDLILALEHALSMAKQPSVKVHEVIGDLRERLQEIQNPHRALENELDLLVQSKTPPGGEFYRARADRKELAVAFFHRVYGRFYEAGVLYKHQLRAMDANFTHLLDQYKEAPQLPTKQDANDVALAKIGAATDIVRLASAATRRKRGAA